MSSSTFSPDVTPKACLRHDDPEPAPPIATPDASRLRYRSRRRYRLFGPSLGRIAFGVSPFETRPNRSLPPLERGCGVSPSQAA